MAIKAQETLASTIITDAKSAAKVIPIPVCHCPGRHRSRQSGLALDRSVIRIRVPRVVGKIKTPPRGGRTRSHFLRSHTQRRVKVTVPGPFSDGATAQIDYYDGSREAAAMTTPSTSTKKFSTFSGSRAEVVQIDEPYMQARPDDARAYGLKRSPGSGKHPGGTTAVAHSASVTRAIIHSRPEGYSFLPELSECSCSQISIETAQSKSRRSFSKDCRARKIMLVSLILALKR